MVSSLPLSLPWLYLEKILTFVGQDPEISAEAGQFAIRLIPALYAYAALQPLTRYYQTQSLLVPIVLSSCVTLIFHVLICWTLVFRSGWGNLGAATAIGLSYWLNVILLGLYMMYSPKCTKTRVPPSMEVIHHIGEFFSLAVPSAVMIWYLIVTTSPRLFVLPLQNSIILVNIVIFQPRMVVVRAAHAAVWASAESKAGDFRPFRVVRQ